MSGNSKKSYFKAHKALERFSAKTGMTDEGRRWLIAAIDPFHDIALEVQGVPDRIVGKSITQCIKRQTTVSVTDAVRDVLITTDNQQRNTITTIATLELGFLDPTASVAGPSNGGLMIQSVHTGADPLSTAASGYTATALSTGDQYQLEKSRVISRGFEVHNVTPELYKGGGITCFRQNQTDNGFTTLIGAQTAMGKKKSEKEKEKHSKKDVKDDAPSVANRLFASQKFVFKDPAPRSISDATLLPGSQGWEASKGCYCVATQFSPENPPTYPSTDGIIWTTNDAGTASFDVNYPNVPTSYDFPITGDFDIAGDYWVPKMGRIIPFNTVGAYFTGLPVGTELTVFFNEWIERFPNQRDEELVVLAKPSACYDPIAIEAYAHIVKTMPVAMPAKANGLGDWFCDAVAGLIDFCTDSTWASSALGVLNSTMSRNSSSATTNQGSSSVWRGNGGEGSKAIVAVRNDNSHLADRRPKPLPPIPRPKPKPGVKPAVGKQPVRK